jgi:hypothetical protein
VMMALAMAMPRPEPCVRQVADGQSQSGMFFENHGSFAVRVP